jgi:predicted transcriptional regulator
MSPSRPPQLDLGAILGPLELRVLETLWDFELPATVRELMAAFEDIAYTTLMTTLDRLHRKGYLSRSRQGRAFAYWPAVERAELTAGLAGGAVASLLPDPPDGIRPWISMFVDEVGRRDARLLDELEREIRRKREEGA